MGMNWTRTSYLFLVMIMISVGVTSAYAITITLGADPVNVQGTLVVDGDLDLTGPFGDDDTIFFNTLGEGSESLKWDFGENRFEFTRGLAIVGPIETGANIFTTSVPWNQMGTGVKTVDDVTNFDDLVVTGNIEVLDDIYVLGSSDTDFDAIFFDVYEGPYLAWDDIENQFEFNGGSGLALTGVIQAGNQFANVAYNRLGTTTTDYSGDINANNDLLISGSLEVDGPSHFDSTLTVENGGLTVIEGTITAGSATFDSGVTISGVLNLGNNQTATIFGGIVNAFRAYHAIAAEGGPGADTLDTIQGGVVGDLLIIKANTGSTITIPSATGNILNEGATTIVLSAFQHVGYIFDGTNWLELFRSAPSV